MSDYYACRKNMFRYWTQISRFHCFENNKPLNTKSKLMPSITTTNCHCNLLFNLFVLYYRTLASANWFPYLSPEFSRKTRQKEILSNTSSKYSQYLFEISNFFLDNKKSNLISNTLVKNPSTPSTTQSSKTTSSLSFKPLPQPSKNPCQDFSRYLVNPVKISKTEETR